ncbi:type IV secretion system protein [Phenylobacterium sp.]|uniref:type IV secretion system protein n=1 Tax=Phenylobacterium sp. TaxID=1871053 RepID=UPI002DF2B457|nr:type IV secretion system protein [Phenylobacterium sp.]
MSDICAAAPAAGVIRGVISAVDCRTRDFAEMGYHSLTGAPLFQTALTLLLTIYVAVLGYRLLFATQGARMSEAPGVAIRIGAVLTLVASWSTFQTLVFDLAAKAPLEIAALVAAPLQAQGSNLAADPVNGLQSAYDELNAGATAFGKVAPAVAKSFTSAEAAAGQALADAAGALFATTAGVVSVAAIALAVLSALGPVFITLFLFRQTRGLFEGWVRAMCVAALAPLGSWILIIMMLTVIEPGLGAMARQRAEGVLDPQAAMTLSATVAVFCAAQVALLAGACLVAMGFRWPSRERSAAAPAPGAITLEAAETAPALMLSRAQRMSAAVRQLDGPLAFTSIRRTVVVRGPGGAPGVALTSSERMADGLRRPPAAPRRRLGAAR